MPPDIFPGQTDSFGWARHFAANWGSRIGAGTMVMPCYSDIHERWSELAASLVPTLHLDVRHHRQHDVFYRGPDEAVSAQIFALELLDLTMSAVRRLRLQQGATARF